MTLKKSPRCSSLAVIIPVLNDAAPLEQLLIRLIEQWEAEDIYVVDGGSRDDSCEVARRFGVHLIPSPESGRASQMNLGVQACQQDALWFLHADMVPPLDVKQRIQEALAAGHLGGAFSRRFSSPSLLLRTTCWLADWRGRLFGWFLGDQAIFVRRDVFNKLGGYPEIPAFEDLEFSRALSKSGSVALLRPPLLTSARRFETRGPLRQTLADLRLTLIHLRRRPTVAPHASQANHRE